MRKCALGCGHPVGRGDRHAKNSCPPAIGRHGERYERQRRNRRNRNRGSDQPQRGVVIPGTGGPKKKGSSKS